MLSNKTSKLVNLCLFLMILVLACLATALGIQHLTAQAIDLSWLPVEVKKYTTDVVQGWGIVESIFAFLTMAFAATVMLSNNASSWKESLEKRLTVVFTYGEKNEEREVLRCEYASLAHEGDIRNVAQQIGKQYCGGKNLEMNTPSIRIGSQGEFRVDQIRKLADGSEISDENRHAIFGPLDRRWFNLYQVTIPLLSLPSELRNSDRASDENGSDLLRPKNWRWWDEKLKSISIERSKAQHEIDCVINLRSLYAEKAYLDDIDEYCNSACVIAKNKKSAKLTGQAPVWMYLCVAHALHGKVRTLFYDSPASGAVSIFDHDPRKPST